MKSKKLKGLIAIAVVGAIVSTIAPVKASAEWVQDSQNNWNFTEDGTNSVGWKQVDGTWYHFDGSGKMQTGWVKAEDSKWYYMNTDGSMKTGWLKDTDGKWYDLAPSGEMKTGWLQDTDGKQYFLSSSGAMQTGVVDVDGKEYALDASGAKLIGTNVVCESNQYTTDANGVITVGNNASNGAKKFTNEGVPIVSTATNTSSTGTATDTTATTTDNSSSSSSSSSSSNSSSTKTPVTPPVTPVAPVTPVTPVAPVAPVVPIATLRIGSTKDTATIDFSEELYWKNDGVLTKNIDYDMVNLPKAQFEVVDFAGIKIPNAITHAVYSVADKKITFTFDPALIKSNGYKLKFLGENYDSAGNALVVPSDEVVAIYEDGTWTTKPSDPPTALLEDNSTTTDAAVKFSEELYWNDNGTLIKNIDFDMMTLETPPFEVVDGADSEVPDAITSAEYSAANKEITFTFDDSKISTADKLKFLGENYDAAGNPLAVSSDKVVAYYDGTAWTTKQVLPPKFSSTTVSLDNNEATLGCVGTNASTEGNGKNIVSEKISSDSTKIVITSVGEGNTLILVSAGSKTARIPVTVEADGTIKIGTIQKYTERY